MKLLVGALETCEDMEVLKEKVCSYLLKDNELVKQQKPKEEKNAQVNNNSLSTSVNSS